MTRITTTELADGLAQLARSQEQMAAALKTLIANQQHMAERIDALQPSKIIEELEAALETPEQVRMRLERETREVVLHQDQEPRLVSINGAGYWIVQGENTVPQSVALQYRCSLQDEMIAEQRRRALQSVAHMTDKEDTYSLMEQLLR